MVNGVVRDAIVKCRNLSYSTDRGIILDKVSFDLHRGDIVTVIGPNGGGKTTLAKIIIGIIKPSKGSIEKSNDIRIGYMPQRINLNSLMPITVKSFFALGKNKSNKDHNQIINNPKLQRILHKQLYNLSGGELQLVLFSKTLLQDPELLILDEPTQGLDVMGQDNFYNHIYELRKKYNKTILMISHDLHTVMKTSDKIICLNHHIHCSGGPSEVKDNVSYKNMFASGGGEMITTYSHKHHKCNHD